MTVTTQVSDRSWVGVNRPGPAVYIQWMRRLLPLPFLLFACQDYPFYPVCPESVEEATLSTTPVRPAPVDILFVVDDSGSMADEQMRIAENFDAFLDRLSTVPGADYRIAVVSTDLDSPNGVRRGEVTFTWQTTEPYFVQGSNKNDPGEPGVCTDVGIDHGCFRGPDPDRRIITSGMTRDEQLAAFRQNVQIGSCGSGTEQGLAAAVAALGQTGGTGCNAGFLRQDANLVLVFVTDEEDASRAPVESFVNDLSSYKPWEKIRVGAIIGAVEGSASGCRTVGGVENGTCGSLCDTCPGAAWCGDPGFAQTCDFCSYYNAPDCCSAVAGSRYEQFLQEVDGRVKTADPTVQTATLIDSICQDDFSPTLDRIARELVATSCFDLDPAPVNREGVVARIAGGRELDRNTEFSVSEKRPDSGEWQLCLEENVLGPEQELELFFVTKVEQRPGRHPYCQ